MSRNSAGNYSLPSGNPVITDTKISSNWANNTLADIGTELTSSLDRSGRGAMLDALQLAAGTAGAPALTFAAETNSGFYRNTANDLRLSVNANAVQHWLSTGVVFPFGATLTQSQANTPGLTVGGNGTAAGIVANGGSSGGAGGTFTGGGTSGNGVVATGTGSSSGVVGTGGATNGVGAMGTGGGSGAGGQFTGGLTNGPGVVGAGVATGVGGQFTGGSTGAGGDGVVGAGGATGRRGVLGTGGASGPGVWGNGGSGNGTGVGGTGSGTSPGGDFTGGGTNGAGVKGTGNGNGPGGSFFNAAGSTSAAVEGWSASAAAGVFCRGGSGAALRVDVGHAAFTGGNPPPTTAYANTQTPKNLVKAWGRIAADGSGGVTLLDGFNVSGLSIALGGSAVLVNFATGMADANYAVLATPINLGIVPVFLEESSLVRATGSFGLIARKDTGIIVDLNVGGIPVGFMFMALGAQ